MIAPAAARKIDRLARHAHAFHRFAHHPLCPAYAGEVVAVGRRRVCKGCLLAGTGLLAGFAAGWMPPPDPLVLGAAGGLGGCLLFLMRPPRPPKLLSRFLPTALAMALVMGLLRSGRPLGLVLAVAVLLGAVWALRRYRRRGPWRAPCETCPERLLAGACSGYRAQIRRERAFRRLASRWAGGPP